jgi:hypothetical protein
MGQFDEMQPVTAAVGDARSASLSDSFDDDGAALWGAGLPRETGTSEKRNFQNLHFTSTDTPSLLLSPSVVSTPG